jgi:murein DD-endopeptidase MepM/ murein hydrolase activator NlpD
LQLVLPPAVQAPTFAAVVAVVGALAYFGASHFAYVRLVGDEELAVARAESANVELQDDVANLRDRLAAALRDRAVAEDRLSTLASQADTLRGQLEFTAMTLHGLEQKLSEREALQPPEQAAAAKLGEPVLPEPTPSGANPGHPEVSAPENSAEPQRRTGGIAELARRGIGEFERVLASAGVNVARLFSQFGVNHPEGGPFLPPPRADQPLGGIVPARLTGIRGLAKALPLSAPVENYQVGSRFGPRRDPFNGRPAYHTGLDFDAAYMSPIYATAPGIVTFAGSRGAYGRVVEIDHGNGIASLYGHMHRYTVSVGQRVEAHTLIGLIGSTGRASGPHVHYEVIVNGQPQDPEKFMQLAHLVPVTEK